MWKSKCANQFLIGRKPAHLRSALPIFALTAALLSTSMSAFGLPNCVSSSSDSDGDGYGWENNQSCRVTQSTQPTPNENNRPTVNTTDDGNPRCTSANADPDGDGWGWESNRSCVVEVKTSAAVTTPNDGGKPVCSSANADPDGDGWGWESNRSCVVANTNTNTSATVTTPNNGGKPVCTSANADPDGDGWGWENSQSCVVAAGNNSSGSTEGADRSGGNSSGNEGGNRTYSARDITDLVLIAGQSNTLGTGTSIDLSQDGPHHRVLAYTSEGWRVAALYQSWDQGMHPGNGNANASTSQYHNNFALHFGKQLAAKSAGSVVGIILTSQPGEGIQHWDRGNTGYRLVQQKVLAAINEVPHKSTIDGLLWHQGETDWLFNGTSDQDVSQPAPANYYPNKLRALIANFRSEPWYASNKPFICGETISADGVNTHLRALNNDSDPFTACVAGAGLPSLNPGGAHFNASALRTIGQRYANTYYQLTN